MNISELEARDANQTGSLTLTEIQEVRRAIGVRLLKTLVSSFPSWACCFEISQAIQSVDPLSSPGAIANALIKGLGLTSRTQLVMHDIVEYRALLKVGFASRCPSAFEG